MEILEYPRIFAENKGAMVDGKLKMTNQHIIFKSHKTGKVQHIASSEIDLANFQNFSESLGLRLFLKNGDLHRFIGFKDTDKKKISIHFTKLYNIQTLEKELSIKGWNWGTAKFNGSVLTFDVGSNTAFDLPLNYVSSCTAGKNEVTMEFHQNEDAPVNLVEMRFFIPTSETVEQVDPVQAFHTQVMKNASVINVIGDALAVFKEIHCLTPRGRYEVTIYPTFIQLHGKTFDYKVSISSILRMFLLPHEDNKRMFFILSLDSPLKHGQTRHHLLVLLFENEDQTSIELPFSESEIKEKYQGEIKRKLSGPTYDVLGNLLKVLAKRKITCPGTFMGHSGTPAISCTHKAAAGFLYPLERGFIFVHKPPIHIIFEEILTVNFARGGGTTKSFDFEVGIKSGIVYTFNNIVKEEYAKLYDFISSKQLPIKHKRTNHDTPFYVEDFLDSDDEAAPDVYLEHVKAEGQEREDTDDELDEDFHPGEIESDVAEEYDSNASTSSSSSSEELMPPDGRQSTSSSVNRKAKKQSGMVKRPSSAFMLWLNENRKKIKSDYPGLTVTEIAKKGGEMWNLLEDKRKWQSAAEKNMEEYKKQTKSSKKTKTLQSKSNEANKTSGQIFKSKQYVESESSSDAEDVTLNTRKEVVVPR